MSTGTKVGSLLGLAAGAALAIAFPPAGATGFALAKAVFGTAMMGLTLGGGIGAYLDPLVPDVSGLGSTQDPQKLDYPTATEGILIPDFSGTSKLTGNFLWYTNNRVEDVETSSDGTTVEGGKGTSVPSGSAGTSTHKEYYLTWIMGICMGPVDELIAIYRDQDCIWSGSASRAASSPVAGVTVEGVGQLYFFFGTDDQYAPSTIDDSIDINIPYRGQCYALFYDCYIGDYNRVPTFYFVVKKMLPDSTMGADEYRVITTYDINPAHALWHVLTAPWMCGIPVEYIDLDSFQEAAYTFHGEDFGIGIVYDVYASAISYMEGILAHIDGVLRWNALGKLELKLLRSYGNPEEFPTISSEDLTEPPSIKRRSWMDTINEIKVQFTNRYSDCPEEEV